MDNAIRRVFMFLLGVSLGYCTGFQDAQDHDRNVFVRIVYRVQNFAENTIGEPARERERAAEEVGGN
ncbi:MAG: hypothetical protein GWN99_01880 [Gemmatimonadetes bacterium]|uniref:Uncharacterized protein n=1 Tax=Candidatus Kutchimonas denitrificans TaxID=3056748 RepID=A0AAE4Z6E4_9BACT|nr:hypothetical protein [Gemmatimonadota bacterium]NIR74194.1 hypothetical protein [Candidatus Kutchimonas denitrificans]NIR99816.1 hypothetical protein [Gemmatimonadota bacterium]NIT65405.1 hypothetical protein [Gemmatimonadota bacterium]NIU51771.1 hypothetical protein [Gemmatimonadota bacterium]